MSGDALPNRTTDRLGARSHRTRCTERRKVPDEVRLARRKSCRSSQIRPRTEMPHADGDLPCHERRTPRPDRSLVTRPTNWPRFTEMPTPEAVIRREGQPLTGRAGREASPGECGPGVIDV